MFCEQCGILIFFISDVWDTLSAAQALELVTACLIYCRSQGHKNNLFGKPIIKSTGSIMSLTYVVVAHFIFQVKRITETSGLVSYSQNLPLKNENRDSLARILTGLQHSADWVFCHISQQSWLTGILEAQSRFCVVKMENTKSWTHVPQKWANSINFLKNLCLLFHFIQVVRPWI